MNNQLVPYKPQPRPSSAKKAKQPQNKPPKPKARGAKRRTASVNRAMSQVAPQGVAAAYSTLQIGRAPKINTTGVSSRIVHREMLLKVGMTVNYAVQQIPLNPGLPTTFPWLSTQARGWETYRFNRLRFVYITRVGTGTGGSLIMAPDYNSSDLVPGSELIATAYSDMAENVCWKDIICTLRPEGMHSLGPKKFVRTFSLGANQDIKTYDVALLNIATTDGLVGPAGNIWAEYDITFSNPTPPSLGYGTAYQRILAAAGSTSANPLSLAPVDRSLQTFGTFSGQVFTFTVAGRFSTDLFISAATSVTEAGGSVLGGTPGGVNVDYAGLASGNGSPLFDDIRVTDAVIGTTITYPVVIVGAAGADFICIPLAVKPPPY